ncbi:hypothetical protein NQ314_021246 [Rhamnusium bicolor]|uniref:Uncharacterized protein n=1 Tax=Rhamnusium bicolor TaxID=1586634 RepID=A0AAV8WK21_9CUCU|nr:hypothetical protein NQ314_021246 [Rhamnusium bicolor]
MSRSIAEEENTKKRSKRETYPEDLSKRSDSFLRFGRNSNFMRFGRDPTNFFTIPTSSIDSNAQSSPELSKMKHLQQPTLNHLLAQLMAHKQFEYKPCVRAV